MGTEFEELKLTVTLVDNTSALIVQLNQTLLSVNRQAGAVGATLNRLSGHANVFGSQARGLAFEIEKLYINIPFLGTQLRGLTPKIESWIVSLPLWTRYAGFATAAVAALGVGLVKLGQSLGEFAKNKVAQGALARSLGITAGEFEVLQKQLTSVMSKQDSQQTIIALGQVTQAMQDGSSELRREFIQGAAREYQDQAIMIADGIARLGKGGNLAQVSNFIKASLQKSYEQTAAGPGGLLAAGRDQAEMLRRLHLPANFMSTPTLRDATAEEVKHEEEVLELSKNMAVEWGKVVVGAQNTIEAIESHLLRPMHDLAEGILSLADEWDSTIGGTLESTLKELNAILTGVEFIFNMKDKIKGALTGEHAVGGAGGAVVPPLTGSDFFHFGPGGVIGPLNPYKGFFGGGGIKQEQKNDITQNQTKELSDLNDSVSRLLQKLGPRGIPKLGRGGIITSPTLALIGESGPEAVGPLRAMQEGGVVDKPTLALLGEGGPEAVVPLRRGRALSAPNVPGAGRSNIRIPHTAEERAGWQQYFTNPLADIEQEMSAQRSVARQAIASIPASGGPDFDPATGPDAGALLGAGKAAWETLKYLKSPIGAIAHTTIGRVAGGAFGGRGEGSDLFADILGGFVPGSPSAGFESAMEYAEKTSKVLNLLPNEKVLSRMRIGSKILEAGRAAVGSEAVRSLLDRSLIDRKQGAVLQANQTGNSDINVEVPPDAQAGPSDDLFKQHRIVRQTQMEKAREGPPGEGVFIPSETGGRGERIYTAPGGGVRG